MQLCYGVLYPVELSFLKGAGQVKSFISPGYPYEVVYGKLRMPEKERGMLRNAGLDRNGFGKKRP